MLRPQESSCHNKALVLLLMFWHEKVTAIHPTWSSSLAHHISSSFLKFFSKHLQCEQIGEGCQQWGAVIEMDLFLYESWHSLPHGKGRFLEGGNGFFSRRSPRWAECKLHPAWPLHKTGAKSHPPLTVPFSPHHQLDPERSFHCAKKTHQTEQPAYMCCCFFFHQSVILSLLQADITLQLQ